MSIWNEPGGPSSGRRRYALLALWAALPLLGFAYQIAAKQTAEALRHLPLGAAWLVAALSQPWGQALVALEITSFIAWMAVLSQIKLSAAFPMTAASYVLIILASWFIFHEQASIMQVVGGAAILAGVWLIGHEPKAADRTT